MNYEVQQALDRKADKWQVHNLESEISRLKAENSALQHRLGNLESNVRTLNGGFVELLNILIEIDQNSGGNNNYQLQLIRNFL